MKTVVIYVDGYEVNRMTPEQWIASCLDEENRRLTDNEITLEESVQRWNLEQEQKDRFNNMKIMAKIIE